MLNLSNLAGSVSFNSEFGRACDMHFSQSGEDIAIDKILVNESVRGMFVDVGAYHPIRFSNTYLLYMQGWRGVNIDGNKEAISLFEAIRPQDININALVSNREEQLEFFRFPEGVWNTTNREAALELNARREQASTITAVDTIVTTPIMNILDRYVGSKKFDLLTIDCEGMDLEILLAIDFARYRPKVIAVEVDLMRWTEQPLRQFLTTNGYSIYAQCIHTTILRRDG